MAGVLAVVPRDGLLVASSGQDSKSLADWLLKGGK
jgi:hypothetical protein